MSEEMEGKRVMSKVDKQTVTVNGQNSSLSLRERKKRQTREAIADVALKLFIERGFEAVTLAEIANAANVSVNTIFNYFHTKEELFFDRQIDVEDRWSCIVRERASGETVVAALRRDFLTRLANRDPYLGLNDDFATFARIIQVSQTLQSHERVIGEHARDALARTLANEMHAKPSDMKPHIIASMIHSVYTVLLADSRKRLLAGEHADAIYPELLIAAQQAFDLLEMGIGSYGASPTNTKSE